MGNIKEWSEIGQQLAENGTPLFCPNCKFKLHGERFCPNCNTKIVYSGENPDGSINKIAASGNKMMSFGNKMEKAGNSMSNLGTSMTLGCTIPILIIILIMLFL